MLHKINQLGSFIFTNINDKNLNSYEEHSLMRKNLHTTLNHSHSKSRIVCWEAIANVISKKVYVILKKNDFMGMTDVRNACIRHVNMQHLYKVLSVQL